MKFVVIDRQTNKKVGKEYDTYAEARRNADRRDMAYGGYRYYVKEIVPAPKLRFVAPENI